MGVDDDFTCPACGHDDFETVEVTKFGGARYVTEFIACLRCHAMLWRPDIAGKPRAPNPRTRMMGGRGGAD